MLTGQRHTDCDLAVVLFAKHPTILTRDPNRMFALLREACVVNDPEAASREIHLGHYPLTDPAQHLLIGPIGLGHKVVQCLVPSASVKRIDSSRHRLHTLTR